MTRERRLRLLAGAAVVAAVVVAVAIAISQGGAEEESEALTRQAERLGRQLGVDGTPSFYLVRDAGEHEPIEIEDLGEALGGG